jgi:sensor c-di-GMP phosphodiesterase-like protein
MIVSADNRTIKVLNDFRRKIATFNERELMTRSEVSAALVDLSRTITRVQNAPTLHAMQQLTKRLCLEAIYLNEVVFVGGYWGDARRDIDDELCRR